MQKHNFQPQVYVHCECTHFMFTVYKAIQFTKKATIISFTLVVFGHCCTGLFITLSVLITNTTVHYIMGKEKKTKISINHKIRINTNIEVPRHPLLFTIPNRDQSHWNPLTVYPVVVQNMQRQTTGAYIYCCLPVFNMLLCIFWNISPKLYYKLWRLGEYRRNDLGCRQHKSPKHNNTNITFAS